MEQKTLLMVHILVQHSKPGTKYKLCGSNLSRTKHNLLIERQHFCCERLFMKYSAKSMPPMMNTRASWEVPLISSWSAED